MTKWDRKGKPDSNGPLHVAKNEACDVAHMVKPRLRGHPRGHYGDNLQYKVT